MSTNPSIQDKTNWIITQAKKLEDLKNQRNTIDAQIEQIHTAMTGVISGKMIPANPTSPTNPMPKGKGPGIRPSSFTATGAIPQFPPPASMSTSPSANPSNPNPTDCSTTMSGASCSVASKPTNTPSIPPTPKKRTFMRAQPDYSVNTHKRYNNYSLNIVEVLFNEGKTMRSNEIRDKMSMKSSNHKKLYSSIASLRDAGYVKSTPLPGGFTNYELTNAGKQKFFRYTMNS